MNEFDQKAAQWDAKAVRVERAQAVADGIKAALPLSPRLTALDYGCGTGLLSFALQPYLWTTLIVYLVSIPLGIAKAVRDGTRFDSWTTSIVTVGNAIPAFLFAILLIVLFAGGRFEQWFPLRGLVSDNWDSLSWPARIADYFWHMTLPLVAMVVGSFATLTMLTKNSFLEQINQQYVMTARAKGLTERRVLYGHVFRNAMLIVIGGFPAAFIGVLFGGALLIEIIFSLDGLGLLGYDALIQRDYPVLFANMYVFSLIGLVMNLVGDFTYTLVDPRIDFESRAT